MNSLPARLRSRTSLAIGLYCLVFASLILLANAQVSSMRLFQAGQSVNLQ
jgi:hypothetical protein